MLTDNNGTNMYMPVAPAYGYGNGNNSGFGGDNAWWIIILLLFGWGGGRFGNFGGGFGGNGGGDITIGSVNDGYNGALQRGFDQQSDQRFRMERLLRDGCREKHEHDPDPGPER